MISALRACLNAAVEDGSLDKNPAARMGRWLAGTKAEQVEIFRADELSHLLERR